MENQPQIQQADIDLKTAVIEDDQETSYWSNEFGIAKEELIAVIKRGGTLSAAIENYVKTAKLAL